MFLCLFAVFGYSAILYCSMRWAVFLCLSAVAGYRVKANTYGDRILETVKYSVIVIQYFTILSVSLM